MNMVLVYTVIAVGAGMVIGFFLREMSDWLWRRQREPEAKASKRRLRRLDARLTEMERDNLQMDREIHMKRRLVEASRENRRVRRKLMKENRRVRRELMRQNISRFIQSCIDALDINSH